MARSKQTSPSRCPATTKPASSPPGSPTQTKAERKKHRWKPGTQALREVKRYQKTVNNVVQRAPFERLFREIAAEVSTDGIRFEKVAVDALHVAAEEYVQDVFKLAMDIRAHHKQQTLKPEDMQMAVKLIHRAVPA